MSAAACNDQMSLPARHASGFDARHPFASDRPATPNLLRSQLGWKLRDAESVGWSPETPGRILVGEGKHVWSLTGSHESLPFARHAAPNDAGTEPASTATLASRAAGLGTWGVLRGDVDNFGIRIRRAADASKNTSSSP